MCCVCCVSRSAPGAHPNTRRRSSATIPPPMTHEATHDPRPPMEPGDPGRRVRRLLQNATWLISGNALASGLGFVQAVVLGQALGVEGYGLLAVVIALVSTVNQVVDI